MIRRFFLLTSSLVPEKKMLPTRPPRLTFVVMFTQHFQTANQILAAVWTKMKFSAYMYTYNNLLHDVHFLLQNFVPQYSEGICPSKDLQMQNANNYQWNLQYSQFQNYNYNNNTVLLLKSHTWWISTSEVSNLHSCQYKFNWI